MGRSFFITGGTGLIGRALVRRLLIVRDILGIEKITLLSRNPERFKKNAPDIVNTECVNVVEGDVKSLVNLSGKYTDFIHGAADVKDLLVPDRIAYAWGIVEGTKRTLEVAEKAGCKRYLYLSSGAVYGPGPYPEAGIPENWCKSPPLDSPATAYGQSKRYSEHLCSLYAERNLMAIRIARIFSVIGPESPLNGQYALGNFIQESVSPLTDSIRIKGDGTPTRSYLHVDDLAQWLIAILDDSSCFITYNVGAQREISIRELADLIKNLSKSLKPVIVENTIDGYAGRSRYFPDCSLIRKSLKVKECHCLENAITELIRRCMYG